ncbi:MAG TPA: hypothetical protein VL997_13600 [Dyella sp.]|nr:hypothetical protein [Dyella sp.]
MALDERLLETMRSNYANMSDEQLALIAATKSGDLTEEARLALKDAIAKRDPHFFQAELDAAKDELVQQENDAEVVAQRLRKTRRMQFRVLTGVLLLMCVIGGVLAISGDTSGGYAVAACGMCVYAIFYLRRLLSRAFWAALNPNYRSRSD